jgi:hypothetical protein
VCSPLLSSANSYCLQSCEHAACPASTLCTLTSVGNVCLASEAADATPISCAAPALEVGAVAGPAANPGCRTPVVASAFPAADVQALGVHKVGEQLSFSVPAGAAGFSIVSQAVSTVPVVSFGGAAGPNLAVPSPLLTPGGSTFFTDLAAPPDDLTTALLVSGLPAQGDFAAYSLFSAALNFPNSSAGLSLLQNGGLAAGTWSFVVNDYAQECLSTPGCDGGSASSTYDMSVVVSPGPLPSRGNLAVDVYLVTTSVSAAAAVASPAVQGFASRFASFYAEAGVCIGSITFHDVPAWAQAKYASLSVASDDVELNQCSDYHQLFTLAEPSRSMALFFVDDLVNGSPAAGDEIVGQDGAIPGLPGFNGTIAGGAVVLAADLTTTTGCGTQFNAASCGPDLVAGISAHETGHFLGLFHPTESTGDAFDPLIDTPACVCALCETDPSARAACSANPDGGQPTLVANDVCSGTTQQCSGANLMMFWLLTSSWAGAITPEEAAVMRANPLIAAP